MNTARKGPEQEAVAGPLQLQEFLENVPPGEEHVVVATVSRASGYGPNSGLIDFKPPVIQLHCSSDTCEGLRFFDSLDEKHTFAAKKASQFFLNYRCRNCVRSHRAFALVVNSPVVSNYEFEPTSMAVRKYGEFPAFGAPTPPRLLRLLDTERPYFLKGRRAESQGMGIAAFAYYRRVVENKKSALFDQVIRVAQMLNAGDDMIRDLKAARAQVQFSQAVEVIKHGIPPSLLIAGHNPLTLLHAALSKGLHAESDQACLEIASSIRYVLGDLVERIDAALKHDQALMSAVSKLMGTDKGAA